MKELLILRHGKSDWDAGTSDDHERPLNNRGAQAAAVIGQFLTKTGRQPDLVVSSTAVRAITTARLAKTAGKWVCEIETDRSLYGASVTTVLTTAARFGDPHGRLLIAGHEPTSSSTVAHLTGAQVRFPTAGLACIGLPIDSWEQLKDPVTLQALAGRADLQWFVTPKLLGKLL